MVNFEERQTRTQEKLIQRPDVEWVSRPNYNDQRFFRRLELRLRDASHYITPDKLERLTEAQSKTRIGRALHVYSMWAGRISMYGQISPLLPAEFKNNYFSGLFGRAQVVYSEIDKLGSAIHTAIHAKNIKIEDFPEEIYGFGAVQLRLMELRDRNKFKVGETDEDIDTPKIEGGTEEKITRDRDVSSEEIARVYSDIKKQFDTETPLASFSAEEYLDKMDQIAKTYLGVTFEEALYQKSGLTQRQAREVLRHMDMVYPGFLELHKQQYQSVLRLTQASTDFDWESALLHKSGSPLMSTEVVFTPDGRAGVISNQVFNLLKEDLSTLSQELAEFVLGDDFVYYSRNDEGGKAGIISGLPYPETKPFIMAAVSPGQDWDNVFTQAHELGHVFQMMFELAELDDLSKHIFARNYQEKKLDESTTAEIFSHLAVNIFFDNLLERIKQLHITENEKLVLEIQIRMAFEAGVVSQIYNVSDHDADPQYLGYAFGIEVAETRDTQAALDRMEEGTLSNFFNGMREYGYVYEFRRLNGKIYNTYLPLPGQSLPEEVVPYNHKAELNGAVGNGTLYIREVRYISKTSDLAHHISHDQFFKDLPYQIAAPTALGLWSVMKRVIEMGKLNEQDAQTLWQDLAVNHEASFQELVEIALERINSAAGMNPKLDFTSLYGVGMKEMLNNKRQIVECLKRLETIGLPEESIKFEEVLELLQPTFNQKN